MLKVFLQNEFYMYLILKKFLDIKWIIINTRYYIKFSIEDLNIKSKNL